MFASVAERKNVSQTKLTLRTGKKKLQHFISISGYGEQFPFSVFESGPTPRKDKERREMKGGKTDIQVKLLYGVKY